MSDSLLFFAQKKVYDNVNNACFSHGFMLQSKKHTTAIDSDTMEKGDFLWISAKNTDPV